MAISVPIVNGQYTTDKLNKADEPKANNGYDKEMFLQLLVAEMQYQDPLEPTDNTEYVSELASFSQIEAVQAVQDQMATLEANSLVGKYVTLNVKDSTGNTKYVEGRVDVVTNDPDQGMLLKIDGEFYSIKDLESVCDADYYEGVNGAATFENLVKNLPDKDKILQSDKADIENAAACYNSLNANQQGYVDPNAIKKLTDIINQYKSLFGEDSLD